MTKSNMLKFSKKDVDGLFSVLSRIELVPDYIVRTGYEEDGNRPPSIDKKVLHSNRLYDPPIYDFCLLGDSNKPITALKTVSTRYERA